MKPWYPPWAHGWHAPARQLGGNHRAPIRRQGAHILASIRRRQSSLDCVLDHRSRHQRSTDWMELKNRAFHVAIKLCRRTRNDSAILHLMPHTFAKNPGRTQVASRRQRRRWLPQHARELDNQDGVNAVVLLQSFLTRQARTIQHLRQYGSLCVGKARHLTLETIKLLSLLIRTLGMSRMHQIHDILGTKLLRRKDVDQLTSMRPRHGILKGLGVDVRSHLVSDFVGKRDVPFLKYGMHPTNADPVRTLQMAHGRILARTNHTDHGLIVVVEDEVGVFATELLPQCYGRKPQT